MSQSTESDRSRIESANRLLQQNRLDEARSIYEELCTPDQQDVDLWLNLALVYRKSGNFEKACATSEQALLLNDDYALAHHIHGSVQQCLGQVDRAINSYLRALELDPSLTEAHYFMGNVLQMTGKPEEAVKSYRSATELRPDYLEAFSNLGAALMSLHKTDEARAALERARSLCPECEQILCNLGDLSLMSDDHEQAETYARSALTVNPKFYDAHVLLGKIYRIKGDYDRALEYYNDARAIRPRSEDILGSIAEILEVRGEFDEARKLLDQLLKEGSTNPLVLRIFSALSRHYKEEERATGLLETALQRGGLDLFQRIKLHSELGKQYDRLEKYPQAFAHYRQANEDERQLNASIRSKQGPGTLTKDAIGTWFQKFGVDFWRGLDRSGNTSDRPVFVVGMPRSGTTLAEQILASHPDVHGAGELPDLPDLVRQIQVRRSGHGPVRYLDGLDARELAAVADQYLVASGAQAGDALRVVDKLPMNFWHLGVISLLFPNARIIHMQRDPRDVCLSIYFQRFDASMAFTTDLEELAEYYMAYARIMEYWHAVLDIEILDVRYEDLVAEQEKAIRRMIGFCGLDWDERCLEFYRNDRDVNTPSYDQVRQPMYSRSVGRWKNYRQKLAPLIVALGLEG